MPFCLSRLPEQLRVLHRPLKGWLDLIGQDDWGLSPLTTEQRRDLLEILEDRHGRGSTMVTSQLPVENWHEIIGDPTMADAILDRRSTTPTASSSKVKACERPPPSVRNLTLSPSNELMRTPTREQGPTGGRDHRNTWPASIGMGGRLRSEFSGRLRRNAQS